MELNFQEMDFDVHSSDLVVKDKTVTRNSLENFSSVQIFIFETKAVLSLTKSTALSALTLPTTQP